MVGDNLLVSPDRAEAQMPSLRSIVDRQPSSDEPSVADKIKSALVGWSDRTGQLSSIEIGEVLAGTGQR
jgi:hypothetical protein